MDTLRKGQSVFSVGPRLFSASTPHPLSSCSREWRDKAGTHTRHRDEAAPVPGSSCEEVGSAGRRTPLLRCEEPGAGHPDGTCGRMDRKLALWDPETIQPLWKGETLRPERLGSRPRAHNRAGVQVQAPTRPQVWRELSCLILSPAPEGLVGLPTHR